MHAFAITILLTSASGPSPVADARAPAAPAVALAPPSIAERAPIANPFDLLGREARAEDRQRCLTAAGAGLAGALVGGVLVGAPAYIVGVLQNKGPDGELVGEPTVPYQRVFVPAFTFAGVFLGGALATVGTYYLVDADESLGVIR